MTDLTQALIPAFALDCRDWIAMPPQEADLGEVADGDVEAPCLAVLSTAVIADDIHEATAVILVGVLDGSPLDLRPVEGTGVAFELAPDADDTADALGSAGTIRRFVVPAPTGELALLAEFELSDADPELGRRVEALIRSFSWQRAA